MTCGAFTLTQASPMVFTLPPFHKRTTRSHGICERSRCNRALAPSRLACRTDIAIVETMTAAGEHPTGHARAETPTPDEAGALWSAVDGILARATVPGVLAHRLGPLAAARMRRSCLPVPDELLAEER